MRSAKSTTVSVADAKRTFADLLGRVAYRGETIVITRHGKPMARLVPAEGGHPETGLADRGWLDADDPFFEMVDRIVAARVQHRPRVLHSRRGRARTKSRS